MTLFRKVFQNQSRPASDGELPDEQALRTALTEIEPQPDAMMLDAFEHATDPEQGQGQMPDVDDPKLFNDDDVHSTQDASSDMNFEESRDADLESNACVADVEEALAPSDMPGETAEDTPIESDQREPVGQTDEEIAACLGRALAADAPLDDNTDVLSEESEIEDFAEEFANVVSNEHEKSLEAPSAPDDPNEDSGSNFAQEQLAAIAAERQSAAPMLDLSGEASADVMPAPAAGRAGRRAGRVKTRLLGFNRTGDTVHDPLGQAPEATATAQHEKYPVGWLVIVEGPGVGHSFSIFTGASMIGRGEDQVIRLDFGDNSISRQNHAAVAYDEEQNKFYIGHGGKSNIIRRNARPVLSTEELQHADLIRIGETTLRFVALCGSDFQWNTAGGEHAEDA